MLCSCFLTWSSLMDVILASHIAPISNLKCLKYCMLWTVFYLHWFTVFSMVVLFHILRVKKSKKNAYHEPLEVTCLVQFDELYLYVCYSNGNEITEVVLMQVCQWSQYCGVCTNEAKNRQRTAATFHVSVDQQDIRPALLLEDTQSHHSAKGCCQKC